MYWASLEWGRHKKNSETKQSIRVASFMALSHQFMFRKSRMGPALLNKQPERSEPLYEEYRVCVSGASAVASQVASQSTCEGRDPMWRGMDKRRNLIYLKES